MDVVVNKIDGEKPISNRDVAKGAGSTLLARLGSVIDIIAQPVYVWMLGLASYGIYSVLWTAINLVENVADLGLTSALQRTVPQAKSEQEAVAALRSALVLGVGPCFLVAALISLFAPEISHIFNAAEGDAAQLSHMIAVFAWALPLWAFVEIGTSALRARQLFGAEIRLRLFWEQLVRLILAVGFWLLGFGTLSIFYAHLASLSIVCLLCVRLLAQHYDFRLITHGPFMGEIGGKTLQAGLASLPNNLVSRAFADSPALILNAWIPGAAGATAAGLFTIARKLSSLVQLVRLIFSHVLAPIASLASTHDMARVQSIYGYATRVSFAVATPVAATMSAGSNTLLAFFGRDALAAKAALIAMIIARALEAFLGPAAPIQQVIGGFRGQMVGSLIGLAVAAVIVLSQMPAGGLSAMTIAVAAGLFVASAIPVAQLAHYEKIHPFGEEFVRTAAITLGLSGLAFLSALGAQFLPAALRFPALIVLTLASLWCTLRFALPEEDRASLGKVGRALRITNDAP